MDARVIVNNNRPRTTISEWSRIRDNLLTNEVVKYYGGYRALIYNLLDISIDRERREYTLPL